MDTLLDRESRIKNDLAGLDRRRQRVWEIGEAGDVPASEVKQRLAQISADRERYESELTLLRDDLQRAQSARSQHHAVEAILGDLARCWPAAPLDCQQEVALALGAIVGGFWLAPGRRGRGRWQRIESTLLTGLDSPSVDAAARYMLENMREVDTLRNVDMAQRKMDAFRTIATRMALLQAVERIRSCGHRLRPSIRNAGKQ